MEINGKVITIAPYTRGIDRKVNEKMLEGVEMNASGAEQTMNVPAVNASKAQDLMIELLTGLSQDELDALTLEDYNKVAKECQNAKEGKKK